jgi:hypothetical protein
MNSDPDRRQALNAAGKLALLSGLAFPFRYVHDARDFLASVTFGEDHSTKSNSVQPAAQQSMRSLLAF